MGIMGCYGSSLSMNSSIPGYVGMEGFMGGNQATKGQSEKMISVPQFGKSIVEWVVWGYGCASG